jgi:hypothetical protein
MNAKTLTQSLIAGVFAVSAGLGFAVCGGGDADGWRCRATGDGLAICCHA